MIKNNKSISDSEIGFLSEEEMTILGIYRNLPEKERDEFFDELLSCCDKSKQNNEKN